MENLNESLSEAPMHPIVFSSIQQPQKQVVSLQQTLFDCGPKRDQSEMWWGMPEFTHGDATPQKTLLINFLTYKDFEQFCKHIGFESVTKKTKSVWFPERQRMQGGSYCWTGPKMDLRYPVYIPSKGRWDVQTTGLMFDAMGIDYRFVVEECEADQYIERLGVGKVLVLPFSNLGQGSIPARNWIWDHAISSGAKKHWVVDDNIDGLVRCNYNRRLSIKGTASPIAAIEDWCDRYENIAFAGPHHQGFVDSRRPTVTPIWMNRRVYSFILVNTSLPYRWRGKYNEDTDICLRALKDGWCTVLFRSLLMNKGATLKMKGGNTETVYAEDEHRRKFAESLAEQHPDVVKITYKFGRWHHQVDYSPFERNPLLMRPDVVPVPVNDEYGLELVRLK